MSVQKLAALLEEKKDAIVYNPAHVVPPIWGFWWKRQQYIDFLENLNKNDPENVQRLIEVLSGNK